jgi:hypothetical protein
MVGDRTPLFRIAGLAMTILLSPAGYTPRQVSKTAERPSPTQVPPNHRYLVTPGRYQEVVIDRRQLLVGTMGGSGVSIHPHPRGQMIVCLEPSPCAGIIGVDLSFSLKVDVEPPTPGKDAKPRDAIVLACKSKPYFQPCLSQFECKSVLLTTGFMAPEAYTLEAAVAGWLAREAADKIKERAALAYDKHQKCGLKAATRLFYSE